MACPLSRGHAEDCGVRAVTNERQGGFAVGSAKGGRANKPRKQRRASGGAHQPDEAFESSGITLQRFGRQIVMETHFDAEEHEVFVTGALDTIPTIEADRARKLERLEQVLLQAGPGQCVALASLTYSWRDPNTYRESQDDRSPAHIEFLALRALPHLAVPSEATGDELHDLVAEALELTRGAFDDTATLIMLRSVAATRAEGADVAFEEYRRTALQNSLMIRGTAYEEHSWRILRGCFATSEEDCRRVLGFTATEAERCTKAIVGVIESRVQARLDAASETATRFESEIKRARRRRELPPELATVKRSELRSRIAYAAMVEAFDKPMDLACLAPEEISERSGVALPAVISWLKLLTCPPEAFDERYHSVPSGGHPLTQRPFLQVDDRYMVPSPSSTIEALRPLMEDALRSRDADAWGRYEAARGRWLEEISVDLLAGVLPGSVYWVRVEWAGANDSSDMDGLLSCDDLALRVQGKSGRISTPARRGAPSMVEDIQKVISDAAHQHSRLTRALTEASAIDLGFSERQGVALNAPLTIEVIVCLDDVTVWSTETHKLRHIVAIPQAEQVPWVLSLADLMATTDILQGAEFVHYLTRRQRLEREGRIEAHDELDWVGNYIADGLWFDPYFSGEGGPDAFRLMSYTEDFDTWYFGRAGLLDHSVERPRTAIPPALRELVARLESQRPAHWVTAAVLLLNGDEEFADKVAGAHAHVGQRAASVGWAGASFRFESYGLSFLVNLLLLGSPLEEWLTEYARMRASTHDRSNWVAVGQGRNGQLRVGICETNPDRTVAKSMLVREGVGGIAPVNRRSRPRHRKERRSRD